MVPRNSQAAFSAARPPLHPPLPPGPPPPLHPPLHLPLPPGPPPPLPPGPPPPLHPPLPPGPPPPLPDSPDRRFEGPATASVEPLTRAALEAALGFRVLDFGKYESVFTHKSAVRDTGKQSYERFEFVGDSVINFVVAKYLYDRFPEANEGYLTRVRTKLVSGKFLAGLSEHLGLHRYVVMNRKAIHHGWFNNPRIKEDLFEAVVGCIYTDLGLMSAKTFVLDTIERFSQFHDVLQDTNYKDALMRFAQARGMPLPEYRVLNDPQVTRQPLFRIVVFVNGAPCGQGSDASKKGAEQKAAQQGLHSMGLGPSLIL
jgi:ribonuclease-3